MIHTITIDTMETAEHSTVPTYSIEKKYISGTTEILL